jgi:Uma2 family endonuclease
MNSTLPPPTKRSRQPAVLPLENGEHLSVVEFLVRYEAAKDMKKCQLIEGTVYMPSPVRADAHAEPDGLLQGWLFSYAIRNPGLKCYPNATLLLDQENAPQPDAILCSAPKPKHRVWLNQRGYLCGSPELVCEISASTRSIDMHEKKRAYRRAGVTEYLVWLTEENTVAWFHLTAGEYQLLPVNKGLIHSKIFPGLVLDTKALLKRDGAKLVAALGGSGGSISPK